MRNLNILIVDDSIVYRKILNAAVEATNESSLVQTVPSGAVALEYLKLTPYDVVLLDVNMPEMNGIEALRRIKKDFPKIQVVMVSGTGGKNAQITIDALEIGALDFIVKPLEESYERNMEIIKNHLRLLFVQIKSGLRSGESQKSGIMISPKRKSTIKGIDLILIASSTGGPMALEKVITGFSVDFTIPILLVQHMPPDFTKVLAESLDKKSHFRVIEGKNDDTVISGQVIVAPGGVHMILSRDARSNRVVRLTENEYVNGVKPSADVLFKAVAKEYAGSRIMVIVLTGMGNDGVKGVYELKQKCTCYCITQSEETCVVYGMPRSIVESGLSDEAVHIDLISKRIQEIARDGG